MKRAIWIVIFGCFVSFSSALAVEKDNRVYGAAAIKETDVQYLKQSVAQQEEIIALLKEIKEDQNQQEIIQLLRDIKTILQEKSK